jgi:pyridoxal biosynthesis lyase PdxS
MKAFIAILILAAGGYLAYTYLYVPMTDEEKIVHDLEKRFDEASRSLLGAERMAGSTGLDTTSDADQAIRKVRRIENELKNLKPTFKDESTLAKAEELEKKIRDFKQKVGLL